MVDMWDNNKLDHDNKNYSSRNMLDNKTMENKCEQLKSSNESNDKRSKKYSTDAKSRNKLDIAKKIENSANYISKVYNISEKYIIKDTNRKSNSVTIISTEDNNIQVTTMINTDNNQTSTSSNKGILNSKFLCEINQMESKSKSKNATVFIANDILVSNKIEHEFELTNSRNKIEEDNSYSTRNIFEKEKTNKQSLKNISKNKINQCQNYNTDNQNNSSRYKKEKSIIDEASVSKDNYIDLSFDTISKEEIFVKSKKIETYIQYKPVIQRREEETKEHLEN